mgnify:CR=1 FL=1
MKQSKTRIMVLSAMFLAIAFVLPFLTGQVPQIGAMLCPMHLPVILCGFVCGAPWGFLVGFMAPILRSLVLGMPPMFPKAICMAVELAIYGLLSGMLYKVLPKNKKNIYIALILAMIGGRVVWGIAMLLCMGISGGEFGFHAFLAGAITNAIPGIILQMVLIPILVMAVERSKQKN